jgi:hypothetical protein
MKKKQLIGQLCIIGSAIIFGFTPVLAAISYQGGNNGINMAFLRALVPIPVLLIMTSNAPDITYAGLIHNYKQTLSRFVGPTKTFIAGNTLQLKDYSKTDWPWTMFDPDAKQRRHDKVFPKECQKAHEMGAALVRGW